MAVQIGVIAETLAGERRVAITPDATTRLVNAGHSVAVQTGAGEPAGFSDALYTDAGATIAADAAAAVTGADVVLCVNMPPSAVLDALPASAVLIGMLAPLAHRDGIDDLAKRGATAFAMELIPRTSRAQSMDVLSSMSTIAGNRAVIMAADNLDKIFPMLMTAAGTVAPARVLVLGAGVAGLQAIATARRLGAVVSAFDTRSVVKEQVESLGASFLAIEVADAEGEGGYARELTPEELTRQNELVADHVAKSDVVITTALVPGRPAPRLITRETVERMRPGAVIVDMASETGGNCEVTVHGETVTHAGVVVMGPDNLASSAPVHASQLYARNLTNLLDLLVGDDGAIDLNMDDDIIAGTLACRGGEIISEYLRSRYGLPPAVAATTTEADPS